MKIATRTLFLAAAALAAARAEDATPEPTTPAPSDAGTVGPAPDTPAPSPDNGGGNNGGGDNNGGNNGGGDSGVMVEYKSGSGPASAGGPSTLDKLKQKKSGNVYQMPPVRVVQARVQGDKPEFVKDRFVSTYGKGDYELGYRASLDTVNTASVEGALMFVQAEGIDVLSRAGSDRCKRKNDMKWIVFYEILIAQTNETIAQFKDGWNVPEYGPMQPMDAGMCTPLSGTTYPPECLQFNGDQGQPNIGPYVGGGGKMQDPRAPYPDNYWFSFPNTCPLSRWSDKEASDEADACRKKTRKGLCDLGVAPDGIECTFAYDILGWVPIDDVVGITSMKDGSGNYYKDFKTWCESDGSNVEFQRGEGNSMAKGLPFWSEPNVPMKNGERAKKVVDLYQAITAGTFVSDLIPADDQKKFKELPSPEELMGKNPPCYQTVPSCNSGAGCARRGFSQLCKPCGSAEDGGCKVDPSFTFPTLAKAVTVIPPEQLTSQPDPELGANGNINGTEPTTAPAPGTGAAASSAVSMAALAVAIMVAATL